MSLEWVFFDVGNVLFNDDLQAFYAYQWVFEAIQKHEPDYTFADLMAERETLALAGNQWISQKIAKQRLPDLATYETLMANIREELPSRFDEFHLLNPGLPQVLEELKCTYRLGIIANQPEECRHGLRRRGLLDYFEVVAISKELELFKPDPELYRWALQQADCPGERAVMIGDRRDNDVHPAGLVGMKTILVNWPDYGKKLWQPQTDHELQFVESLQKAPLFDTATENSRAEPDAVVTSLRELPEVIQNLHE